jgi:hypothetical protein
LYLLRKAFITFEIGVTALRVMKWTYNRNQYENGTEKKKGDMQDRKSQKRER